MTIVSIEKASELVGKSSKTIYRHIKMGKLSRTVDGIDTAELIRVYGVLKDTQNTSKVVSEPEPVIGEEYSSLRREVEFLKSEVASLKQDKFDAQEREKRLFQILESRLPAPVATESDSLMSSIIKKWF